MNKVLLIGRLTRDAELIEIKRGDRKAIRFTLAIDRGYKNSLDGSTADFIPVIYFTNYSQKLIGQLVKGRLLSVSGKISIRSIPAENNSRRYFTNIEADKIDFLDKSKSSVV